MKLSAEEQRMLGGESGPGVQRAMELLVALGEAYDAPRMVRVASAHLVPPDLQFWTTGELALWAHELVVESVEGATRFKVATTINPYIFDPDLLKKFGYPQSYVDEMRGAIATGMKVYEGLGVIPTYTCCPFLSHITRKGEHLGAAETSVALFVNSVLGAMTNRDSGPAALAAALTGRTPLCGVHLPENRLGQVLVKLKLDLDPARFTSADYCAMGYHVGGQARDRIPVYVGLPEHMSITELLHLSSSHSCTGSHPMFHAVGITPEAPTVEVALGGKRPLLVMELGREEIRAAYEALSSASERKVDFVLLGCPHATLEQVAEVARLLAGKIIHRGVNLILATGDTVRDLAVRMGLVSLIEDAGGFVVSRVCSHGFVRRAAPPGLGPRVVATDSAGAGHLLKVAGVPVWFGTTEDCVKAAVAGRWRAD